MKPADLFCSCFSVVSFPNAKGNPSLPADLSSPFLLSSWLGFSDAGTSSPNTVSSLSSRLRCSLRSSSRSSLDTILAFSPVLSLLGVPPIISSGVGSTIVALSIVVGVGTTATGVFSVNVVSPAAGLPSLDFLLL